MLSLEITDLGGKDRNFHFCRTQILCAMAYPAVGDLGAELRGQMLYELGLSGIQTPDVKLAAEAPEDRRQLNDLELLLLRNVSHTGTKTISGEVREQIRKGFVAGSVLKFALRSGQYHPEHRSVSKAIFLESRRSNSDPTSSTAEASVSRCWKEFKSVAHLYTALVLLEGWGIRFEDDTVPADSIVFDAENATTEPAPPLPAFTPFSLLLSLADAISEAAHNQLPPIGRSSTVESRDGRRLIDQEEIVRITGGPERIPTVFHLNDLTQTELDTLAKYRRYPSMKLKRIHRP
jgi:hypothetical protein